MAAYAVFGLFFFSLIVLGLTSSKIEVNTITVSGNTSILSSNISSIAASELNKKYLWIIPTDNFFLLRKSSIQNDILNTIKTLNSVKVSFQNIHTINIAVSERAGEDMWCSGTPTSTSTCYSMDKTGFIFAQSNTSVSTTSPYYFGLINGNPIGQIYFGDTNANVASANTALSNTGFALVSNFFHALVKMNFNPRSFYASDDHEYEIYLVNGGKIMINDKKTFDQDISNLQALIDNGFIKTDKKFLQRINYIDLRYGNKIDLTLNLQASFI